MQISGDIQELKENFVLSLTCDVDIVVSKLQDTLNIVILQNDNSKRKDVTHNRWLVLLET